MNSHNYSSCFLFSGKTSCPPQDYITHNPPASWEDVESWVSSAATGWSQNHRTRTHRPVSSSSTEYTDTDQINLIRSSAGVCPMFVEVSRWTNQSLFPLMKVSLWQLIGSGAISCDCVFGSGGHEVTWTHLSDVSLLQVSARQVSQQGLMWPFDRTILALLD